MAIRMKALRSFGQRGVNEGHVKRGREFSAATDQRRKELEAHGLAYLLDAPKAAAQPLDIVNSPEKNNEASEQGPFVLAGGGTGAEDPAPSSPPVHRRRRRR